MRNFNEMTITDAVLDRIKNTSDPRLKQIFNSLVRHMHDFVRDVRLTDAEWSFAIEFLTRTGQKCDGNRQEFILLSDTLGVSMLVDAINHGSGGSTETTVLGPFYVQNPPEFSPGADIHGGMKGEPLYAEGRDRRAARSARAGARLRQHPRQRHRAWPHPRAAGASRRGVPRGRAGHAARPMGRRRRNRESRSRASRRRFPHR